MNKIQRVLFSLNNFSFTIAFATKYKTNMNTPVYTINPKSIDLVAKIAEKVGEIKGAGEYSRNLRLRKINRLHSIQSSLVIENNMLYRLAQSLAIVVQLVPETIQKLF
jgi:Fic family protein